MFLVRTGKFSKIVVLWMSTNFHESMALHKVKFDDVSGRLIVFSASRYFSPQPPVYSAPTGPYYQPPPEAYCMPQVMGKRYHICWGRNG